jgi:hypothetical protein
MSKSKLYQPPPGTYDLPYSWIYNLGSVPADGSDLLNQFVYIRADVGGFVLRRIVGHCRTLKPYAGVAGGTFGSYQFYDRMHAPLEASPAAAWGAPVGRAPVEQDMGIVPEEFYPETGRIGLDLYNLKRPTLAPNSAQIAFQGVRRIVGYRKRQPDYRATPKTFTYHMSVTINDPYPAGPITRRIRVDDYDFELYNLIFVRQTCFAGMVLTDPVSAILLYDQNHVPIASKPMLDIYCDGHPLGIYKNGAIVTPLYYQKDSQIQIDFFSQIESQIAPPVTVHVYLVGKQYLPC